MELKRFTFKVKEIAKTGLNWNETLEVTIKDTEKIIDGFTFRLQGSIAGCGLCIVRLFNDNNNTHNIKLILKTEKEKGITAKSYGKALIEFVSSGNVRTGTDKKGCILATLGSSYINNEHVHGPLLKFIKDMGFKEILEFDNLAHDTTKDTQKIFALSISRT